MKYARLCGSAVASIVFASFGAGSSSAAVLLSSGFDTYGNNVKPGAPFSTYESGAGATIRTTPDASNFFGAGTTNDFLSFIDNSSTNYANILAQGIANATPVETLSFDYYEPTETGTGTAMYLRIGAGAVTGGSTYVFQFQLNDGTLNAVTSAYSLDTDHHFSIVLNNTAAPVVYNNGANTVSAGSSDVYIDGTLVAHQGKYGSGTTPTGTALSAFALQTFTADANQTSDFDNVVLTDSPPGVPEPASISAVVIVGAGLMRRRRA